MKTLDEYIEAFGEPHKNDKPFAQNSTLRYIVAWNFRKDRLLMDVYVSRRNDTVDSTTIQWWDDGIYLRSLPEIIDNVSPELKELIVYNFDLLK